MAVPAEWTAPDPEVGPAPGVEWASPGARLVGYIVDLLVQFGLTIALLLVGTVLLAVFAPLGLIAYLAGSPTSSSASHRGLTPL